MLLFIRSCWDIANMLIIKHVNCKIAKYYYILFCKYHELSCWWFLSWNIDRLGKCFMVVCEWDILGYFSKHFFLLVFFLLLFCIYLCDLLNVFNVKTLDDVGLLATIAIAIQLTMWTKPPNNQILNLAYISCEIIKANIKMGNVFIVTLKRGFKGLTDDHYNIKMKKTV